MQGYIQHRIEVGYLDLPCVPSTQSPQPLSPLLTHLSTKEKASIEQMLREHQLKEALRAKDELQHRLTSLQDSIRLIEGSPGAVDKEKVRKPVLDAATRHLIMQEEQEKRKESLNFVRRKRLEQAEIRKRKEVRAEIVRSKMQQQFESDGGVFHRMEKFVAEMKARKLEDLQAKADRRREALIKQLSLANNTPNPRTGGYFYQKALEEYQAAVEHPENERRFEQLSRKKVDFLPINRQEIEKHAKKHDVMLAELKLRKERLRGEEWLDSEVEQAAGVHVSRLAREVLQRDLAEKEAREKAELRKKQLANKRLQYGDLVKEMYAPLIDPAKHAAIEEMKYHSEPQRTRLKKDHSLDPPIFHSPVPKAKSKPAISIEQSTASKSQDYLALRRQSRDHIDYEKVKEELNADKLQQALEISDEKEMRQLTEQIERNVRRQERKLAAAAPTDLQALQLHGSANDVIITSIRAKLALLSSSVL